MEQKKRSPSLLLLLILLVTIGGCAKHQEITKEDQQTSTDNANTLNKTNTAHTGATSTSCEGIHFTYEGEDGPEHWGELCDGWSACGQGHAQSPVNISNVVKDNNLHALDFEWNKTRTNIVNNGHTIQFNVDPGSKLIANGKSYNLLQFHYHHSSEHTIYDKHYPLEVHFVTSASDGKMAVVGIMYKTGKPNPLFNRFLSHFPTTEGSYSSPAIINLSSLLPHDVRYYHYIGSLTTPACSEMVNWNILLGTVEASEAQLEQLTHIIHDNHRPLQPLNGRVIKLSTEEPHHHS